MGILFFIILVFLFLLLFASSIIFTVIRGLLSFLGLGVRNTRRANSGSNKGDSRHYGGADNRQYGRSSAQNNSTQWHFSPEEEYKRKKRKKIISPDEGEYVDFEEIK